MNNNNNDPDKPRTPNNPNQPRMLPPTATKYDLDNAQVHIDMSSSNEYVTGEFRPASPELEVRLVELKGLAKTSIDSCASHF